MLFIQSYPNSSPLISRYLREVLLGMGIMDSPAMSKEDAGPHFSKRELAADAQEANTTDRELSILQAMKLYPKAVAWSMIVSAASIMDGYDYHVISSLFAQPAFQKAYGELQQNGSYQITAPWQSGLNNGSSVGCLLGLYLAGHLTDKFGFRKTIMFTLFLTFCFIFIQFFANSLVLLQVGQILLGWSIGYNCS